MSHQPSVPSGALSELKVTPKHTPKSGKCKPVVLAIISDVHAGSTTAVCPDTIRLDDGGEYRASKPQRWLFANYRDYWQQIAAKRDELKAELYVVINGDLVEGDHHKSTQIMSANPNAQRLAWTACAAEFLAIKPDHIAIIRGTGAHAGESARAEETIADGLRRDKRPIIGDPETGTASWWHWRPEIQGVRLDFTHHGRMGRLPRTRRSNLVLYAWDIFDEHGETGQPAPHLCFRGHNHKRGDTGDSCPVRVVATGAWQLGTEHVKKVSPDSLADIGGAYVVIDRGDYEVRQIKYQHERPIWRP